MEILKYILLICLAPIWLPFLKELWGEFSLAMRSEGGIFKAPPGPIAKRKLAEELAGEELRQVSEELPDRNRPKVPGPKAPLPSGGPQTGIVRRPFTQKVKVGFRR